MTKDISLSSGYVTVVDDGDYDWLNQHKWSALRANGRIYASRCIWDGKKNHSILMHRLIMCAPKGIYVDHRDLDSLRNCRDNLRICLQRQNLCNSNGHKDRKSQFKGVWMDKRRSKWVAEFRGRYLGQFIDEEAAARAYDAAAIAGAGEFARPNFPEVRT